MRTNVFNGKMEVADETIYFSLYYGCQQLFF